MSDAQQATQQGDTGNGFIVGTDPRQAPLTAAQLAEMQRTGQQPPVTINVQGAPTTSSGARLFTEEEVGAIRAEEKEKLYGRLQSMEEQLQTVQQEREQREAELAAERQRVADEAHVLEEQQMDVRQLLEKKDQEWNARLADIESQRERDQAIFTQEREWNQLQEYRRDRLEQEEPFILPELRDLVVGSTPADIDNAIEIMKQRSAMISSNFQNAIAAQRGPIRGVAPTGAPPIGPMEQQTAVQTLTADDIRGMDKETFARYREQLLAVASRAGPGGLNRNQAQ